MMPIITRFLIKFGLPTIVAGLLIWGLIHTWNNYKDNLIQQGYANGFSEAMKQYKEKVAANDEKNRKSEQELQAKLDATGEKLSKIEQKRIQKEDKIVRSIEKQYVEVPVFRDENCKVPKDFLDNRNMIRQLGPNLTGATK